MKKKLKNIKMIFADVDNTLLCLHMLDDNGKRMIGTPEYTEWLEYNITHNAYQYCTAPRGLVNLFALLPDAKLYGLTECSNSFEYNSKYNRLAECYPERFKHHGDLISIDDRHKKVLIMKIICKRDNIKPENVMFIDDSYSEVMEAFHNGFFSMHTTEALEKFG